MPLSLRDLLVATKGKERLERISCGRIEGSVTADSEPIFPRPLRYPSYNSQPRGVDVFENVISRGIWPSLSWPSTNSGHAMETFRPA